MGRPPKYAEWLTEDGLALIKGWARDGLTDEQIAKKVNITTSTLYEWKKKFPELTEAIKKGKEPIDTMVEDSLLRRALGSVLRETKTIIKNGKKETIIIEKEIPGDTIAAIFWLKNRKPEYWRDKPIPKIDDEYEDDGLIKALEAAVDDMTDDMEMLPGDDEQ